MAKWLAQENLTAKSDKMHPPHNCSYHICKLCQFLKRYICSSQWSSTPPFHKSCQYWAKTAAGENIANYLPKILPAPSICRKCLLNRGQISVIDHLNPSPLTAVSSIYQFPPDYCPDRTSNNWRIVIRELDVLNLLCKSRYFNLQSQHSKNGHRVRFSQFQWWIFSPPILSTFWRSSTK